MAASTSIPVNTRAAGLIPSAPSLQDLKNNVTTQYLKNSTIQSNIGMGWFIQVADAEPGEAQGNLASIYKPKGNGLVNIIKDFHWTVTPTFNRNDIPYIQLIEHKIEGGQIQKQIEFYLKGVGDAAADLAGVGKSRPILDVYDEIFVRNPTGWRYKFPYFAKVHYELNTDPWSEFDKLGSQVAGVGSALGKAGELAAAAYDAAAAVGSIAQQFKYPVTGIADRPRIFTGHSHRSIKIEFPLYNTVEAYKWQQNREFIYLFHSQNLFNKRNFSTGLPPVWYEVYIPGEYYSVASSVTNFSVENLGNVRIEGGRDNKDVIVPDAYQVSITLQEMAMPSKNQFQAAVGPEGANRVNATTAPAPKTTTSKATPTTPSAVTNGAITNAVMNQIGGGLMPR